MFSCIKKKAKIKSMAWGSDRVAPTKERLWLNTTVCMSSPWRWRESKKEREERLTENKRGKGGIA